MFEESIESVFQSELIGGEKIYWSGKPDPSRLFTWSDLYMIPFSLMWGGFAIFWEASVTGLNPFFHDTHKHPAPFFFSLWGIPFVLMGLYMIFGRFFYKSWRKKRTFYAVTNKRILVKIGNSGSLQALFLNQLPVINKKVNSEGEGSLIFGTSPYGAMYANSGLELFGSRYGAGIVAFYDVQDAERVYKMINELRDKTQEPRTS